jgi:hypothetical protein
MSGPGWSADSPPNCFHDMCHLQPLILLLEAVGMGAELPQAANDLVEHGAEHGRSIAGTKREQKSGNENPWSAG